jgi:Holliday junction resolvase
MKKTMLVLSVIMAVVFTMGYAFAQEAPAAAPAPAEAPKVEAPAAPAAEAPKVEAPAAPAATEEVVVGKLVDVDGKVTIAVEGKEAVAVKVDAKVEEVKKLEKFAEKTFEFKGTFVTEKVKEGDKEVELKLFVIASFAEKAAEAPKVEEKK